MKIEYDEDTNLVLINTFSDRIRGSIIFCIIGIVIYMALEYLFAMYEGRSITQETERILNFATYFYVFLYLLIGILVVHQIYYAIFWVAFQYNDEEQNLTRGKSILHNHFRGSKTWVLAEYDAIKYVNIQDTGQTGNYRSTREVALVNTEINESSSIYPGDYLTTRRLANELSNILDLFVGSLEIQ